MLNQVTLVGKIEKIEEYKKGIKVTICTPQGFKNIDGLYDNNHFEIMVFGSMKDTTKEYCKNGDLIGVKGRLQRLDTELEIIAEKISFLATRKDSE